MKAGQLSNQHLKFLRHVFPNKANIKELNHLLGNIDIYLLDQILKGRFPKSYKILDAGCGEGRNLIYFLHNNYRVYGIDKNEDDIRMLKYLCGSISHTYPQNRFVVGDIVNMPWKNHKFHAIISSAVLHFAENETHFRQMFAGLDRVLRPGGLLFVRMATDVGILKQSKSLGDGKYLLPDGSVRFLLTSKLLDEMMAQFAFEFVEPYKAVVVENSRSMCTLVLKKIRGNDLPVV
jgi:tellurite methyltransferase